MNMNKTHTTLRKALEQSWSRTLVFGTVCFLVISVLLLAWNVWQSKPNANETAMTPLNIDTAWWTGVQEKIGQAEYEIVWQEQTPLSISESAYQAPNRTHNFRSYFTSKGVQIQPRMGQEERWQWTLQLAEFGYAGTMQAVADAEINPEENRITYQYDGITEWYVNDENGLEQGFTVVYPPGVSVVGKDTVGRGELILTLNVGGNLSPVLTTDGSVDFFRADKTRALNYGKLIA